MITPQTIPSAQLLHDARREQALSLPSDFCLPMAVKANLRRRIPVYLVLVLNIPLLCFQARAGQAPIQLGAASNFAVLAGATVTSTGNTVIVGDLGSGPGTAVAGFPPGTVNGTIHAGDPAATQAEADLTTAYNEAAGRSLGPITVAGNLGGQTLTPGLYKSTSSLAISSGDLTLDAQGDANAVFIFQMASTLTTTSGRQVILSGGAKASNIYWQVGSSATLGTTTVFSGTIMAQISITLQTGATLHGRALARIGAVALDANSVSLPASSRVLSFGPISRGTDGAVTLVITNTPGVAFTLQESSNLTNWTTIAKPAPSATPFSFVNQRPQLELKDFYRAFYP